MGPREGCSPLPPHSTLAAFPFGSGGQTSVHRAGDTCGHLGIRITDFPRLLGWKQHWASVAGNNPQQKKLSLFFLSGGSNMSRGPVWPSGLNLALKSGLSKSKQKRNDEVGWEVRWKTNDPFGLHKIKKPTSAGGQAKVQTSGTGSEQWSETVECRIKEEQTCLLSILGFATS